jgi:TPR repeat protein
VVGKASRSMLAGAVGGLLSIACQSAHAQQQCVGRGVFPAERYGEIDLSETQTVFNSSLGTLGALRPVATTFPPEDPIRQYSAAVGRLDVQWDSCMLPCTATLLPDRTIVTARHCLVQLGNTRPRAARMVFNHYSQMDREGDVQVIDVDLSSIQVVQPLPGQTQRPDIAFARLRSAPTNITPLRLAERAPAAESLSLEIIQHPEGLRKSTSELICRSIRRVDAMVYHRCDTVPGSSGSPIMSRFSPDQVFAVHTTGSGYTSDPSDPESSLHLENGGWLVAPFTDQIRRLYNDTGRSFFAQRNAPRVAVAPRNTLEQAQQALDRRDYTSAISIFTNLANSGDAEAQYQLGRLYYAGSGVPESLLRASALYEQACGGGVAGACTHLGMMYSRGRGVAQDRGRAVNFYRQACDGGDEYGCNNAGILYRDGLGVSRNDSRAVSLFRRACERGLSHACGNLANMYSNGRGVAQNYARAIELGNQACNGGAAIACYNLAILIADGLGTERNEARAAVLYDEACQQRVLAACINLGNLYRNGRGVARDDARAVALFRQACEGGVAHGCGILNRISTGNSLDFNLAPRHGLISLAADFRPDPRVINTTARNQISISNALAGVSIGNTGDRQCRGYTGRAPDLSMQYTAGNFPLIVRAIANFDTTLVVNAPDGSWHCDDDSGSSNSNAQLVFRRPSGGRYDIWFGTFSSNRVGQSGRIEISEIE